MVSNDAKLLVLFQQVNQSFFNNQLEINCIFWLDAAEMEKLRQKCKSKRYFYWGICDPDRKRIYLNRSLKNYPATPQFIIEYLIFHEILHLRWVTHCQGFKKAESKFPQLKKANTWLTKHAHLAAAR